MDLVLQLLFTGLGIGAVYALVALGFVLIFRATNVVNFAQGEFSMVAAYLMVVFAVDLKWPYGWSFLASLTGMALLGAIFNLGVYYPLRNRTFLPVIIATIGASIFLANTMLALYGPQPQVLPGWFDTPGIQIGPVYLDSQYLVIMGVTLVLVASQLLVLRAHHARQKKSAGHVAGQGDGGAARHPRGDDDHAHLCVLGAARRRRRHPRRTYPVRVDTDGLDDCALQPSRRPPSAASAMEVGRPSAAWRSG